MNTNRGNGRGCVCLERGGGWGGTQPPLTNVERDLIWVMYIRSLVQACCFALIQAISGALASLAPAW